MERKPSMRGVERSVLLLVTMWVSLTIKKGSGQSKIRSFQAKREFAKPIKESCKRVYHIHISNMLRNWFLLSTKI